MKLLLVTFLTSTNGPGPVNMTGDDSFPLLKGKTLLKRYPFNYNNNIEIIVLYYLWFNKIKKLLIKHIL